MFTEENRVAGMDVGKAVQHSRARAVQQDKEFLYKRDSQGKLVTRHRRLADPSHGTAIKSFRKTEQLKSKLPQAFWAKS